MPLLPYQLVDPVVQIPYRVLPQTRILNLLDTLGTLPDYLTAEVFGVGEVLAVGGEEGTLLASGGVAGEGGGGVVFVAHFDPFVEHCLGFFLGARHGWILALLLDGLINGVDWRRCREEGSGGG